MRTKRFLICAFLGTWLFMASTWAADFVRFRFCVLSNQLLSDVQYRSWPKGPEHPPEIIELVKAGTTISMEYEYVGPPTLVFQHPESEGESAFFSFDVSKLNPGCVFVFWRGAPAAPGEKGKWNCAPLNNFEKRFAKNRVAFFNFSGLPLAAKLGKKVYTPLPPFVEGIALSKNFEVAAMAYWPQRDVAVNVWRTTMNFRDGYRYIGMFFPSPRYQKEGRPAVDFKLVTQLADAKEAEKYEPTGPDVEL